MASIRDRLWDTALRGALWSIRMEPVDVLFKAVAGGVVVFLAGLWWKEYDRAQPVLFAAAIALASIGSLAFFFDHTYMSGVIAQWSAASDEIAASVKERQRTNALLTESAVLLKDKPEIAARLLAASRAEVVLPSRIKGELVPVGSVVVAYIAALFLALLGCFPPPASAEDSGTGERRRSAEKDGADG